ncbi:hypothetical protein BC936DRAFT_140414 [Jimgerdemannia flammicorona]|uniref:Uncharacterized protein n=1 Tax=Jimgerdemannia flammicorona TaxID=994334 RepID=A0A433DMR7_9FUNG|nr:hypothetical protein BC936DRAFT_140414 [Jimgerdemannia flammicorona]
MEQFHRTTHANAIPVRNVIDDNRILTGIRRFCVIKLARFVQCWRDRQGFHSVGGHGVEEVEDAQPSDNGDSRNG